MRRSRGQPDDFERLQKKLDVLADCWVLRPVVDEIRKTINFLAAAKDAGCQDTHAINQCAVVSLRALKKLPPIEHVVDRFLFDAYLIQSVASEWQETGLGVPPSILPRYGQSWSHMHLPLTAATAHRNPSVDIIGFSGSPVVEEIDLLNYPWLIHELGHTAFSANNAIFIDAASKVCAPAIARRRARAISLQGPARNRARGVVDSMENFWGPHTKRNSWALEIAADLFATWTSGPAYGAAFVDYASHSAVDPFKIDGNHPPYFIRTRALEEGTRRLGWTQTADLFAELMSRWSNQGPSRSAVVELNDEEMLGTLVYRLLELFETTGLTRCTIRDVDRARLRFQNVDSVDFGIGLLLDAYVAHESLSESDFGQWHEQVVRHLANQVTQ